MKTPLLVLSAFLLLAESPASSQLPDFYRSVDRLAWVVEDLDKAIGGWRKLGFTNITELGDVELDGVEYRGKAVVAGMRVASGRLGGVAVDWIQPLGGESAYTEFLKKHGSGVFSLVHRAPSGEAFDKEVERLKSLGVGILQSGRIPAGGGTMRFAFMDTEPRGKYVLGLLDVPGSIEDSPLAVPPGDPSGMKIAQYAFAVRDLDAVSKYWAALGFPVMDVTHPGGVDSRYRGKPASFDMNLGWQRHGKVTYEWIISLKGPNVYLDHMNKHGEGVHHLAFMVDDMDKAVERWTGLGFPSSQSGGWGEKGKPGSGRFSYQDTQAIGGIDVELLWDFR